MRNVQRPVRTTAVSDLDVVLEEAGDVVQEGEETNQKDGQLHARHVYQLASVVWPTYGYVSRDGNHHRHPDGRRLTHEEQREAVDSDVYP